MSKFTSAQAAIASAKLAITYRSLDNLTLPPRNPRQHGKRQIAALARSIQGFGFNVPVLVDRVGGVVAGHARVLACRTLGWTEVPTICLDHLSNAQVQAFRIADNRLSELSTWDDVLLGEALRDLSLLNLDFSLELTGFSLGEIDFRIEALDATPKNANPDAPDPADTLPDVPAGPAVTQPGDLWLLGRHRLLCADATLPDSYTVLMEGEQAAQVFTDPPYNVKIRGHVSGLGSIQHREFPMATGEMDQATFTTFLRTVCGHMAQHSRDGSLHFICMDWRHLPELMQAGGAVYAELKNLCVWAKDNAGMESLYRSQHELVLVYKHGRAPHRNNVELGRHGRNRTNVWQYPGMSSFGRKGEEGNLLALHPTVKPVKLVADAILDCSARGEVVLDPFLGSGTTLMAAERVGRRCLGLELDPLYVDTIIRRWQAYTGESAVHAGSGLSFAETEQPATAEQGGVP